ncbi:hypothetical protein ABPG74_018434 [Tetrahymena malaccensis]
MQNLQNQDIDQHHGQQASASLNTSLQQLLSNGTNNNEQVQQITKVVQALVDKLAQSQQLSQQVLNEHRAFYDKMFKENKEQIEDQRKNYDRIINQNEKILLDNQEQRKLYEKGLKRYEELNEKTLLDNQEQRKLYEKGLKRYEGLNEKTLLDNQEQRKLYEKALKQNQEFFEKILLDNQQERQQYQQMIEKFFDSQKKN